MKKMISSLLTPTTKKVKAVLQVALIITAMYANHVFWDTYKVQWPVLIDIKFQPIITERYISPVPDGTDTILVPHKTEDQVERGVSPTATPTPSPKPVKKAQVLDLVGDVEAAEMAPQMSDAEIIAYIQSKDWDDEVAVALAKSENFWNKEHRFSCWRKGAINNDGSQDYGIFQINTIHRKTLASRGMTMDDMLDCKKNIDYAFEHVYTTRGNWSAWSAYNNGSYLNHL